MGNATEDIKDLADEITETNDEDGVAKFLEKLNKTRNVWKFVKDK